MSGRALASAPYALCHGPDRAHLYWGRGFHSSGEKGAEGGPEGPSCCGLTLLLLPLDLLHRLTPPHSHPSAELSPLP